MKNFLRNTSLFLLLTGTANLSHAQDVYNFYFQKNLPAQGAAPVTASGTVAPQSASSVKSQDISPGKPEEVKLTGGASSAIVPSPSATADEFRHWRLGLGIVHYDELVPNMNTGSSQIFSLDVGYDLSRYFGLMGQVYLPSSYLNSFWSNRDGGDVTNYSSLQASLGLVWTPFHINLFGGNTINLSLEAGMLTTSMVTSWSPFIGPSVSLDISNRFSLALDAKRFNDSFYNEPSQFNPLIFQDYQYGFSVRVKL